MKYSKSFGKKEKVLNYISNTYQLTRPNKVGAVMALIRECQPKAFEEWEKYYFENILVFNSVQQRLSDIKTSDSRKRCPTYF